MGDGDKLVGEEILDALKNGAILLLSDSGEVTIAAMDDLSPDVRDCYRATVERDREQQSQCPDCVWNEAENAVTDIVFGGSEGREQYMAELEQEAGALFVRAAKLQKTPNMDPDRNAQAALALVAAFGEQEAGKMLVEAMKLRLAPS
jgi:hypothetical protein